MEDEVEWEPPLGALGRTFGSNVIEDTLDRLFTFRHERLRNDLERHRAYSFSRPMTVAITGSTGLVGSALSALLTTGGHRVLPVVRSRRSRSADVVHWDIRAGEVDAAALEGVDAVVHLAGESLVAFRWTEDKKKEIRESRKLGTGLLARTLARLAKPPKVLLSSSAVGFYGDRGNEVLTEDSGPGKGFLAEVCKDWEAAAEPAQRAGIRVVRLRSGLVLSAAGGALPKMLPAFKAGVAGRLGRGDQYMSWIDIDDALGMVLMALHEAAVTGPLNGTAPHPVTNATFTTTLGRVLGRPTVLPVPGLALKALFGQMGSELFLSGQRVLPRKADSAGFEFFYPGLEESLRFQLGRHSRGD